jgi:alkylation response protein AidB-like acyl-CoA dehydrogenase
MSRLLTKEHLEFREKSLRFCEAEVAPLANKIDIDDQFDGELLEKFSNENLLSVMVPEAYGGLGFSPIEMCILSEEVGAVCTASRSLLTVQSMVSHAISKHGSEAQKRNWLPKLASGEAIGAFAMSEPSAGSDVNSMELNVVEKGGLYVVNGTKKWITFGQIADLILVFGKLKEKHVAFLVESSSLGVEVESISNMLGARGSMLASINFLDCEISEDDFLGSLGFGLIGVGMPALQLGRLSVAFGTLGMINYCVRNSLEYASGRQQFSKPLSEHQLIAKKLSEMIVAQKCARHLCYDAIESYMESKFKSLESVISAKYYSTKCLKEISDAAVQILGARGCSRDFWIERFYRDSKIMEIIEGSNEMNEILISQLALAALPINSIKN